MTARVRAGVRSSRARAMALAVLASSALLSSGCSGAPDVSSPQAVPDPGLEVVVPDVRGREHTAAVAWLESAGLRVSEVVRSHASSISAGVVVYTDPSAGETVTVGTRVAMIVSAGPKPGEVPAVNGKTEDAAREELVRAGFEVAVVYRDDPARAGTVIGRRPAGEVPPGGLVTLIVSGGSAKVRVPDVVGMAWKTTGGARAALSRAGFGVRARRDPTAHPNMAGESRVVGQLPRPGALAPRGAVIRVVVAVSAPDRAGWVDEW